MKKLKLDLEALAVESFDVRPAGAVEGTVHAHAISTAVTCSMSVDLKCFAPQETITADVNAGECNTTGCGDGGSLSRLGCGTDVFCV